MGVRASFQFPNSSPAMGCSFSGPHQPKNPNSGNEDHHNALATNVNPLHHPPSQAPAGETAALHPPSEGTAPFRQYTLAELMAATHRFSCWYMLPKGVSELPNFVYKGRLPGRQRIAVKRFSKGAWPNADRFRELAIRVGRLRHRRLVNLIGYCCDGDERLLVAEFMSNGSLATRLFKSKRPMEWSMRLRVACYTAEALEYCSNEGQALYYDLNPYKVLFDEVDNPCLSCFGLAKNHMDARCYSTSIAYNPPESINGIVTVESIIFSFGFLLQVLLSGKQIPQGQVIEMILGKNIPIVLDFRLKGEYSTNEAAALFQLAAQCMQHNRKDRPTIKHVIATLLQNRSNAGESSNAMPGTEGQDINPTNAGDFEAK